jgi:hypothetical protein
MDGPLFGDGPLAIKDLSLDIRHHQLIGLHDGFVRSSARREIDPTLIRFIGAHMPEEPHEPVHVHDPNTRGEFLP